MMYEFVRSTYRFTVGTISGAVGWVAYADVHIGGYALYLATREQGKTTLSTAAEGAYQKVASRKKNMPKSLFDGKKKGALTSAKTFAEGYVGPLDKYELPAKVVSGAYVAYKLGLFDMANVISKQVELTVETWLGVSGDAYGLFDLPGVAINGLVSTSAYKATVATVSKVPYVVGYAIGGALAIAGPALAIAVYRFVHYGSGKGYNNYVQEYTKYAQNDVVQNPGLYGASTALFAAWSFSGVHDVANILGKSFEVAFEHALGLSGDVPGLLEPSFYS
jgi:hypothetical protein